MDKTTNQPSYVSSEANQTNPVYSKIAATAVPIVVVAALSVFFGILFLPFGIIFGIVALIVIGFHVLRHETVDEQSVTPPKRLVR